MMPVRHIRHFPTWKLLINGFAGSSLISAGVGFPATWGARPKQPEINRRSERVEPVGKIAQWADYRHRIQSYPRMNHQSVQPEESKMSRSRNWTGE
jgi:hypothetical protein